MASPLSVDAVSLDAYGTLFRGGTDDLIAMLQKLHADAGIGAPFDALLERREQLVGELQRRPFVNLRGRDDWILGTIFREFRVERDHVPFMEELHGAYWEVEPYADARPCIDALRERGVRVAILSNVDDDMMAEVLRRNGLEDAFDAVVTSESVGAYKPSRAMFEGVARALDAPPAAVLHVGDSFVADVVGAKRAGMRAAWLARPDGFPAPAKREAEPDLVVESLAELPERVASAN